MTNTERTRALIRDADFATLNKAERASVVVRMLGCTHTEARKALKAFGWDLLRAVDYLRRRSTV